jgi:hypothetical protein
MSGQVIVFDRSRMSDDQKCRRLRYWRYEHAGTGVERAGEWMDLLVGTATHIGIDSLVLGRTVDDAVAIGREAMMAARRAGPIQVYHAGPDANADFEEGMSLLEALVRGWEAVRLRPLLTTYEVLAVERECQVDFARPGWTLKQLSRPDLTLRRRTDGAVFIMNLKTAADVGDKWKSKWRQDMQTFSEALAVEAWLGEPVVGTIMAGMVKGSRKDYPQGSGDYHWTSPLLWPWHRSAQGPGAEDEWYARYEWSCTAPHRMGNGRKCEGGKLHRLSGVHKKSVTERPGGVKGWISWLAANDRELLEEQFVELTPILRSPFEIERWKRQWLPREVEIRVDRERLIQIENHDEWERELDLRFPMSTADGNCVWPSECDYFSICHGVAGDGLEGNGYVARKPNHPDEEKWR